MAHLIENVLVIEIGVPDPLGMPRAKRDGAAHHVRGLRQISLTISEAIRQTVDLVLGGTKVAIRFNNPADETPDGKDWSGARCGLCLCLGHRSKSSVW